MPNQYLNPSSNGSCVANAVATALLYIAHRGLVAPDFREAKIDSNDRLSEGLITIARLISGDDEIETNEVACRIIFGAAKESFAAKEARIMQAIKTFADRKLRLFDRLAEDAVVTMENAGIPLDFRYLVHISDNCKGDAKIVAQYHALNEYLEHAHVAKERVPYEDFGLTRNEVIAAIKDYYMSAQGWLPDCAIKHFIGMFGGNVREQSLLDARVVVRGGGTREFLHLDHLHTYLYVPEDESSAALIALGAKPASAPSLDFELDEEEALRRAIELSMMVAGSTGAAAGDPSPTGGGGGGSSDPAAMASASRGASTAAMLRSTGSEAAAAVAAEARAESPNPGSLAAELEEGATDPASGEEVMRAPQSAIVTTEDGTADVAEEGTVEAGTEDGLAMSVSA